MAQNYIIKFSPFKTEGRVKCSNEIQLREKLFNSLIYLADRIIKVDGDRINQNNIEII